MIHTNLENIKAAEEGEKFALAMENEQGGIKVSEVIIKHTTLEDVSGIV